MKKKKDSLLRHGITLYTNIILHRNFHLIKKKKLTSFLPRGRECPLGALLAAPGVVPGRFQSHEVARLSVSGHLADDDNDMIRLQGFELRFGLG